MPVRTKEHENQQGVKKMEENIYCIKGGWQMLEEMRGMSNLTPRKGLLKEEEKTDIPHYFGFFPLDYYLPGYVQVGVVRTGVLAGPRGKELINLINKQIKEKCKGREYVIVKAPRNYTVHLRIFVRKRF